MPPAVGWTTAPTSGLNTAANPVNEARLLEALTALGGSSGNQTLRKALTWSETDYDAVKSKLVACGRLIPGRGRGGSVALGVE